MTNALVIIAAGVFAAGIAVGFIVVVSMGIHREERRFREVQRRREQQFFQTGEVQTGFVPEDAPDHLTWGARRLTNLYVRRQQPVAAHDQDLLVP
jgi:hypothetical protein